MSSHLKKTRALVVEPYPLFRLGLCHWINREKNLIVCAEAENIRQALEAIENLQPDLVISEISLNGMNSFDWIRRITSDNSNLPILLFTKYDETIYAERALRAGAHGYVMKCEPRNNVIKAIREVMKGEIYLSDKTKSRVLRKLFSGNRGSNTDIDNLNDRELQVFQLIGQCQGTRQIAEALHLSVNTVETYRAHIKRKLNLRNASELEFHSIQWHLLQGQG